MSTDPPIRYAQLGSVISGETHGPALRDDLLRELRWQNKRQPYPLTSEELFERLANDHVESLITELCQFAPPYCYFGPNAHDENDFGYWPHSEAYRVPATQRPGKDYAEICTSTGLRILYRHTGEYLAGPL